VAKMDLYNNAIASKGINPAVYDATQNGPSHDLQGFESANILVQWGTITDGTHTFSLEESDDNATWGAVGADYIQGTMPTLTFAGGSDSIRRVGYVGSKRYIRVVVTVTGMPMTGGLYGTACFKADPHSAPTV
jgi:hypothetical protein